MEKRGLIHQIPESELSDKSLTEIVNRTQNQRRNKNISINLDGAIQSAKLVASWAKELKDSYA